jgi:hypothetical protein
MQINNSISCYIKLRYHYQTPINIISFSLLYLKHDAANPKHYNHCTTNAVAQNAGLCLLNPTFALLNIKPLCGEISVTRPHTSTTITTQHAPSSPSQTIWLHEDAHAPKANFICCWNCQFNPSLHEFPKTWQKKIHLIKDIQKHYYYTKITLLTIFNENVCMYHIWYIMFIDNLSVAPIELYDMLHRSSREAEPFS